jgi:hypothetical protein
MFVSSIKKLELSQAQGYKPFKKVLKTISDEI